jgi:site-specific recombinase XerD
MTVVRVAGFKIFVDRHGKERCYHRKTGIAVDLTKAPIGSAEFFAECDRLARLTAAPPDPRPGTLGRLIAEYRAHTAFTEDIKAKTRKGYQEVFNYLKPICDVPLVKFNRALVVQIHDKAQKKGRRFADRVKAVLSILFAWGIDRGHMPDNPASQIKNFGRMKGAPRANRPWSDEERHAVLREAPEHMKSALALMMFTALGPKDALTLPRSCYRAGEIATDRSKTDEPVFWPAPIDLQNILADAPAHDAITLCVNSLGRPWTTDGSNSSWTKLRKRLEASGQIGTRLTLYGLRHTVAVILRELEYDERTIADALGQKTIEMARHYSRGADLRPKMRGVVKAFDAELNKRRTEIVKLAGESVKPVVLRKDKPR